MCRLLCKQRCQNRDRVGRARFHGGVRRLPVQPLFVQGAAHALRAVFFLFKQVLCQGLRIPRVVYQTALRGVGHGAGRIALVDAAPHELGVERLFRLVAVGEDFQRPVFGVELLLFVLRGRQRGAGNLLAGAQVVQVEDLLIGGKGKFSVDKDGEQIAPALRNVGNAHYSKSSAEMITLVLPAGSAAGAFAAVFCAAFGAAAARAGSAAGAAMAARIRSAIFSASAGSFFSSSLTLSRPCPSRSPSKENHAPLLSMIYLYAIS